MKRMLFLFTATLSVFVFGAQPVLADVNNFRFESFDGVYRLDRDGDGVGTLTVTETLVAVFPEFDQNRGIERSIPLEYKGVPLDLEIISVKKADGSRWNYTTYESGGQLVLRIGDAGIFVQGAQTYVIEYSVRNVISFYDTHDELYWDANGTGWSQPFGVVTATFVVSDELAGSLQNRTDCFVGLFGANEQCVLSKQTSENGSVEYSVLESNLKPGESVSIVLAFNKGTFNNDPLPERLQQLGLLMLVGLPVGTLFYSYNEWRRNGRDEGRRRYITPQYVAPPGLNAVSAYVMLHEQLSRDALSAGILQLATLGYVHILEESEVKLIGKNKKMYNLQLNKPLHGLPTELQTLADKIFDSEAEIGKIVSLDSKKNKLYSAYTSLSKSVPKDLSKRGFFKVDPVKARTSWGAKAMIFFIFPFLAIHIGSNFGRFTDLAVLSAIGSGISGLIIAAWIKAMPARTAKGSQLYDHLRGLKEYIELAEKDRLEFHQSPEGAKYGTEKTDSRAFKLRIYEELLPYALLFGLSKQWSEQFKDLYEQPPEWFSGYGDGFNTLYLADSLNALNASTVSAFTPPANSGSSSGGSGFGGGGFSGGGGGGGGGGGW